MPTTVSGAFEEFFQSINLDREDRALVTEHTDLRDNLRKIFSLKPQSSDFLSGSYARNTIIKPPKDVDFFICFDPNAPKNQEKRQEGATKFHEYAINTIRNNRDIFGEDWRVKSQRRSISLKRTGSNFGFDIIPAFPKKSHYLIADTTDDEWILTNPRKFDELLTNRNKILGNWLKRLIKIVKAWNNYRNKPLKSFYIEVVLYDMLKQQPQSFSFALGEIFEQLQSIIYEPVYDPALPEQQIDYFLDSDRLQQANDELDKAKNLASEAIKLEEEGKHQEAIKQWKKVFGKGFPAPIDPTPKKSDGAGSTKRKRSRVSKKARDLKFGLRI